MDTQPIGITPEGTMSSISILPRDVGVPVEARERDGYVWLAFEDGCGGQVTLHMPKHSDALLAAQCMAAAYNKVAFPPPGIVEATTRDVEHGGYLPARRAAGYEPGL